MKRLIVVLIALAACSRDSSTPIVFGAPGALKEAYGQMNQRGIQLAEQEINLRPERKDRPVQIRYEDDEGSGAKASKIAQAFVDAPEVLAVIGHVSSAPAVAASAVYDGHLVAVATSATSPELTGISKWTFRVISSDSVNGVAIANFANRRGRKRAAILYENDSYGRGLANAFRGAFTGEVIGMDPIDDAKDQRFEPFISYYRQRKPDVIFVAATDISGVSFLEEVRRQRLDADLVGGDGWSLLTADTTLAEGVYVGVPFTPADPRPEAQAFVKAFQKKFNMLPDNNAALAYDATNVVYEAARAGASRTAIRSYLAGLTPATAHRGVTGPIHFRPDGDPVGKSVIMTRIERGALRIDTGAP